MDQFIGYISITLAASGTLQVSFLAAQRANNGTNAQAFTVSIGGTVVGPVAGGTAAFTPLSADYASFTTAPVLLPAGTHALTFTGLNPLGGDNTVFLDAVSLSFVPSSDDPFGYLGGLGYWQGDAAQTGGLTYVRQRWLDTASGSWLSVDPVATEPRYGYAHNAPTLNVDANGTDINDDLNADYDTMLSQWKVDFARDVREYFSRPSTYIGPFERFESAVAGRLDALEAPWRYVAEHTSDTLEVAEQKLFANLRIKPPSAAQYINFRNKLGLVGQLASIPHYGDPQRIAFEAGFIWGVFETAVKLAASTPGGIVRLVISLITRVVEVGKTGRTTVVGDIGHFLSQTYLSFLTTLGSLSSLRPYARGKILGILIGSVVALYFAAKGIVELPRTLTEIFGGIEASGAGGAFDGVNPVPDPTPQEFEGRVREVEATEPPLPPTARYNGRVPLTDTTGKNSGYVYQRQVTGHSYEDSFQLFPENVEIRVDDYRPGQYLGEVKMGGYDEEEWADDPYNPNSKLMQNLPARRTFVQDKLVRQTAKYLRLNQALNEPGVVYTVCPRGFKNHLDSLFRQHFPSEVASGELKVKFVQANHE